MKNSAGGLNKKIRLCIMTTVPISILAFYGKQIDFLVEQGFDVTVITSPGLEIEKRISPKARLKLIPMTRVISPIADFFALIKIFNIIRAGKFDIVQYSTPKAALLGSIASWFCRVKVRLYLMWGLYYTGQKGFKRGFLKFFEKLICACSTHVAPDSNGNLRFAVKEGLCPESKIGVVGKGSSNGVDLERFNPGIFKAKREIIRESFCIPRGSIVAGFVGRLRREKGINELVSAFLSIEKEYPNLFLFLVGPHENDEGEYEPDVRAALARNKRIISAGFQERPEESMAAMDVFVLPSYREGIGTVNIEAAAMELPVISTDIPGPQDSVVNGKTGILVKPGAIEPLAEAMQRLINNPGLRESMGKAGRQWSMNFEQKKQWQLIKEHRLNLLNGVTH